MGVNSFVSDGYNRTPESIQLTRISRQCHYCIHDNMASKPEPKAGSALSRDRRSAGRRHHRRTTFGRRPPATHRDLADRLGVTVGTVTRAYGEAARRGLVGGEVGRGTYVREHAGTLPPNFHHGTVIDTPREQSEPIADLRLNFVAPIAGDDNLNRMLATLAGEKLDALLQYQPPQGMPEHRVAAAIWLAARGARGRCRADPGDRRRAARHGGGARGAAAAGRPAADRGAHLPGRALDRAAAAAAPARRRHGRRGAAARRLRVGLPAGQRQGALLHTEHPESDRQRDAGGAAPSHRRDRRAPRRRDHRGRRLRLPRRSGPPPLASYAPTRAITSPTSRSRSRPACGSATWPCPPAGSSRSARPSRRRSGWRRQLAAEIAARWIRDGTGAWYVEQRRKEARERQLLARRLLGNRDYRAHPTALHGWLRLPEPWRAEDFSAAAKSAACR